VSATILSHAGAAAPALGAGRQVNSVAMHAEAARQSARPACSRGWDRSSKYATEARSEELSSDTYMWPNWRSDPGLSLAGTILLNTKVYLVLLSNHVFDLRSNKNEVERHRPSDFLDHDITKNLL
jgi:hypothetical protein